jgi:hypothetical protein
MEGTDDSIRHCGLGTSLKGGRERLRPNRVARVTCALRVSPIVLLGFLWVTASLHRRRPSRWVRAASRSVTGGHP